MGITVSRLESTSYRKYAGEMPGMSHSKGRENIDICYICDKVNLVARHYNRWICHTDYHMIQRMRSKFKKDTGLELEINESLDQAIVRRREIQETGKWEKGKPKADPGPRPIRIVTS